MSAPVTTTLNDVNLEAVAGLAGKIQQEPEVAATRWTASVSWKGGFRSEAKGLFDAYTVSAALRAPGRLIQLREGRVPTPYVITPQGRIVGPIRLR